MEKIRIIGICGSLRQGSFNRMALEIAAKNVPENAEVKIRQIDNLPFYNQDLETDLPEIVVKFRSTINHADGLLLAVSEYNYSVSAVLKNAIEWASRPYKDSVLNHKPVAMLGASNGMVGTARAQIHLRQILVQTNSLVFTRPDVMIPFAQEKFTEDGQLQDEKTLQKIWELMQGYVNWITKLKQAGLTGN